MEKVRHAIGVTRAADYAEWYQEVIRAADLAEHSGVRGCMVIKPYGYAIWELIQEALNGMIKETGHQNVYLPLLIPLSLLDKEAEHVEGFAKECAVVTHHRLSVQEDGTLAPSPEAKLTEPLVIRPTSEAVFGTTMAKWVNSYNDLPLLLNQWCNVMRWEMRTRLFLRTSEFLWQEGHTAHETADEAREEATRMLDVYASLAVDHLAIPVVKGTKSDAEKFPGAVQTLTIEAMMQDGKALQAGTSHFLGQNFSRTYEIAFTSRSGVREHAWTTSWGVSTRMIGALIMTHSDDDGLVLPPRVAPFHVVIVPMLLAEATHASVLAYCDALKRELQATTFGDRPVRVQIDASDRRAGERYWNAVRRGVPLRIEIGQREVEQGVVTLSRRDRPASEKQRIARADFVASVASLLDDVQTCLLQRAQTFRVANTVQVDSIDALRARFESADNAVGVFVECFFDPACETLASVQALFKQLAISVRCLPQQTDGATGTCVFSQVPTTTRAILARAY